MSNHELLTEKEVAALLKIKPQTLSVWRSRKQGPAYLRIRERMIRYKLSDLLAWLESHPHVEPTDAGPLARAGA